MVCVTHLSLNINIKGYYTAIFTPSRPNQITEATCYAYGPSPKGCPGSPIKSSLARNVKPPIAMIPRTTPVLASTRSNGDAPLDLSEEVDEGEDGLLEADPEPDTEIAALVVSSWEGYGEFGGLISNESEVA